MSLREYFHPPAIAAGFAAVLIGYSSSAVIVFQAARAGLALLSTIANSLYTAVADASAREPAAITFVVTASGLSLFGIGSAFWGLVAGVIATLAFKQKTYKT